MDREFSTIRGAFTAAVLADVLYEAEPDATVWLAVDGEPVSVPVSKVVVVTPDRVELR